MVGVGTVVGGGRNIMFYCLVTLMLFTKFSMCVPKFTELSRVHAMFLRSTLVKVITLKRALIIVAKNVSLSMT